MMQNAMDCPEAKISLGVYVLGAIEPAERALVDAHLATCRDCRDELAGLAGLPALLARVSVEEAMALAATDGPFPGAMGETPEPPRELLGTVLDLTAARRRRRRWRDASLAVAAAVIVAAGVFGGLQLGSSGQAQPSVAVGTQHDLYVGVQNGPMETVTGKSGDMAATVAYSQMGWGTQLDAQVSGIPIGTNCQLWVIGSNGSRVLAANWKTDSAEGTVWYPGSAGVSAKDVAGFEIVVGQGKAIQITA
jgi:hypothetical protein